MMNFDFLEDKIKAVASSFGYTGSIFIKPIENGLINRTFLIESASHKPALLQQINLSVFKQPLLLQQNYDLIYGHLKRKNFFIPALIKTVDGGLLQATEQGEFWRAFKFVANSYSIDIVQNVSEARLVAECFASFASMFAGFPAQKLKTVIPDFHNLSYRKFELNRAIQETRIQVSGEAFQLLKEFEERKHLVQLSEMFSNEKDFPSHVMHHDCKINNILFDTDSEEIICPVDMDTVMPGKFFSDLGDMVRTTCCSVDENSTNWKDIFVREDYYSTVVSAYREKVSNLFTEAELNHLHYSGLILIYMQALRFLTDYLNGNIYYKTNHEEQNLDRAKNQFFLLSSLENYLKKEHHLALS